MFISRIYFPKIENILVFFNFSEDDWLWYDDDIPLQMPANQNLRSALAVARPDLLQTGILENFRPTINQWRVGRNFYSSFFAELPEFELAEVGVTLNLKMMLLRSFLSSVKLILPDWWQERWSPPWWFHQSEHCWSWILRLIGPVQPSPVSPWPARCRWSGWSRQTQCLHLPWGDSLHPLSGKPPESAWGRGLDSRGQGLWETSCKPTPHPQDGVCCSTAFQSRRSPPWELLRLWFHRRPPIKHPSV